MLGIGNSLFHVGGGIISYYYDKKENRNAELLGIFVAPGAIGLFLGLKLVNLDIPAKIIAAVLAVYFYLNANENKENVEIKLSKDVIYISILCFLTVLLRSYCGLAVVFPWKSSFVTGLIATLALVAGKILGGFANNRFGMKKTIIISLIISAIAYIFGNNIICGIIAVFFFNMTMPITLYLLSEKMQGLPGTAFGLLTVALFCGSVLTLVIHYNSVLVGTVCSILSLGLLLLADRGGKI